MKTSTEKQWKTELAIVVLAIAILSCSGMETSASFSGGNANPSQGQADNNGRNGDGVNTPSNNNPKDGEDPASVSNPSDPIPGSDDDIADPNPNTPAAPVVADEEDEIADLPEVTIPTPTGTTTTKKCSRDFQIGGRSNLYLAGMPDGTAIAYNASTDSAPNESPVLLEPDVEGCLAAGSKIYFQVSGQISHGGSNLTDADGNTGNIGSHEKQALYGKSNVTAPLNAMMGVFLGEESPAALVAPAALSFASADSRNYQTLSPLVGQIFFIGNGKDSSGDYQKIVVPAGAKRLFLGIMDTYEWNNNSGQLTGAILLENQ